MPIDSTQIVFWHREMPPQDASLLGEYVVDAASSRVPGTIKHRDELWDRCYRELMANVHERLGQEITRLGGRYAHVYDESIDTRHDDAAGEAWLRGRFAYTLYGPSSSATTARGDASVAGP